MTLSLLTALVGLLAAVGTGSSGIGSSSGQYASLEWMDSRRVLLRVLHGAALPSTEDEVMLDELANWKWRVELSAADAAVLVTFSHCPHGLGLLPVALDWRGGGHWRSWPGTFEYAKGSFACLATGGGWALIDDKAACEGAKGIRQAGEPVTNVDLQGCQEACKARAGCQAVDFYRTTRWCNLYNKACASPDKRHDGASSWQLKPGEVQALGENKEVEKIFLEAKQWCQQEPGCKGFSYSGVWSDKDREAGVPRRILFAMAAASDKVMTQEKNWHSYVRRDNPRANCNPEGREFQCPENPYACLGLSMDADNSAIKSAYRALSRQMHPDKVAQRTPSAIKKAEEAFREISESNEILRDPRKRRQADQALKQKRRNWEEQKASVQDIYIKEPQVSSLEPESYPELLPKGQEWLVHFFLPENGDCKQMKMAMHRVVKELGTGEQERPHGAARPTRSYTAPGFPPGRILRGRLRDKSTGLRTEGAGFQDGDTHLFLVVKTEGKALLYVQEESEAEASITSEVQAGKVTARVQGPGREFVGAFDQNGECFRGTVAVGGKEVASFALRQDLWQPALAVAPEAPGRQKPRLFGAVNCGRFPDFCKRKGADPARHHFPQVRVLFPQEMRFEAYSGRPLGRDLAAFAAEATRPLGTVMQLDLASLARLQSLAATSWLILLLRMPAAKKGGAAAQDCPLCRAALPMLRRSAVRLSEAGSGMKAGWVNCSSEAQLCSLLGGEDEGSDWGSLQLATLGSSASGKELRECSDCKLLPEGLHCDHCQAEGQRESTLTSHVVPIPGRGLPLWDPLLLPGGEIGQQNLLVALEAAVRTAEATSRSRMLPASGGREPSRTEL